MMKINFLLPVLICTLMPLPAIADEAVPATPLLNVVNDFVRHETRQLPGKVIIRVNRPDSRQALHPCQQPEAFLPVGGRVWGKFSVGVRCQDTASWTVYIPVEIEVIARVVHAAQPVSMGKTIDSQDIVSKEADLVRIPGGAITDPDEVIGKVATTFLASGQPIRTHQLRAPHVISRGQKVQLTVIGTGFAVSTEGETLAAAAEGEVVQVRNHTGRIIRGIARQGGVVEIRQSPQ
ncbi:flagellar basal body P-ring formation chaperone FlgA [Nitrosomonas sp.]|uniref:flagellar basal body P-ring formation chaperone FlgA n=1 Tax=Nitrosomonas sp. TaxID=42353 RepID=UPI0025FD1B1D|nr:flagellar basal body P-ring formation chaperone FlgA [Nitrosomonas sp.]